MTKQTRRNNRTPQDSHQALMLRVVAHVPAMGWTQAALSAAGHDVKQTPDQVRDLYPKGVADVIKRFNAYIDHLMCTRLAEKDLATMRVRDRVATAIMTRLDCLPPYREAAQSLARHLAHPGQAPLATQLIAHTADDIWHAIGDHSTGFTYYSKRTTLGLIYSATLLFWLRNADTTATAAFLDKRIDSLMRTGQWMTTLKTCVTKLRPHQPNP